MTDIQDGIDRAFPIMREEWSGAMYAVDSEKGAEAFAVGADDWRTITSAARRVANPDFEAISQAADKYAKLWGFNPSMCRQMFHLGAALALGITEDADDALV